MTTADLLCYIRLRVIQARENQDEDVLDKLGIVLGVIIDAIEHGSDKTYWWVVDDLINAINHTGLAEFKVTIPSEEAIRSAAN